MSLPSALPPPLASPLAAPPATQAVVAPSQSQRRDSYWGRVWARLATDRIALLCIAVICLIALAGLFAPWLPLSDPYATSMMQRLKPIGTPGFILGTDELGRDMLTRLIYGARLSLFVGITPVLIAFVAGSTLGMVAGYYGNLTNTVIMRLTDIVFAFPSVLLAIAVAGILGAGITNTLVALTIVFTPQIIRVAESVTTAVRSREYIDAARASGASALTIIARQVVGNVMGPIFVYATGLISVSMIIGAGLSFLGLGAKPPEAEWGLMLNTLRTAIYINPLVAALPGIMIFITSISFNRLSDGMARAMDLRR